MPRQWSLCHPVLCGAALAVTAVAGAQGRAAPTLDSLVAAVSDCAITLPFEGAIGSGADERLPQVSRAAWAAEAACWRGVAARASRMRLAGLTAEQQRTVAVVRWEAGLQRERAPFWWVDFSSITPYASPVGSLARRIAARPLRTAADTAATLRLLRGVPALFDTIRAGLEQRAARGIRLSRPALPASIALLRGFSVPGSANPYAVSASRAATLDEPTRTALLAASRQIVDSGIAPSVARLLALLEGPYASLAPVGVGLSQYPGGAAYYAWLTRWHTTLETDPAAVHTIGLAEVARIEREMAAIRLRLGFRGDREQFHAKLAEDPHLFATVPEEFGARLMLYASRLDPLLDRAFAARPRARGDVRRLAPELEPSMTFGYYQEPTPADSMGHYFYNGTQLSERSLLTAAPLIAHELWPGHHFQINLVLENPELPAFRRKFYTAYGEGWGDYASIVAGELGLYSDPLDAYGRLAMDMFLSCRLVVDTGMNAFGWTRERAMAYLRAHALESDTQIASESLRYSTDIPGQALAYKMGSNAFVQLRERAQARLGARFELRAFHAQVLGSGTLPMAVLQEKVDAWIASQR
jgi:uncharacterized protein (DUF885 family)